MYGAMRKTVILIHGLASCALRGKTSGRAGFLCDYCHMACCPETADERLLYVSISELAKRPHIVKSLALNWEPAATRHEDGNEGQRTFKTATGYENSKVYPDVAPVYLWHNVIEHLSDYNLLVPWAHEMPARLEKVRKAKWQLGRRGCYGSLVPWGDVIYIARLVPKFKEQLELAVRVSRQPTVVVAHSLGAQLGLDFVAMALLLWLTWPILVLSVDQSKFRTCEQTSFCRRFRAYEVSTQQAASPSPVHSASEVLVEGHRVSAKIVHRYGETAQLEPLTLQLQFFRSQQSCGVVRATLEHGSSTASRETVVHRSVVVEPLEPDEVVAATVEGGTTFTSKSGPCAVLLRHQPFQLEIFRDGLLLQTFNARHFLNYELPRLGREGMPRQPAVDAADLDPRFLWEESFDQFVDRLYNLDVFEYEVDVPMALYGAIPFVTCVRSADRSAASGAPVASGLLALNPSEGFVQVDATGNNTETWWIFESWRIGPAQETGPLELYFFLGPSVTDVLQQYHSVTGLPRMPPLAALGKHQSRWNYITPEDVMEVSRNFDRHGIPLDFLWLDLEHTHGKRYFTWDPKHFPLPEVETMLDSLNRTLEMGFANDPNYTVANLFKEKKLVGPGLGTFPFSPGEDFHGFCWPGPSVYPDFCSLEARAEWAKLFDFKAGELWREMRNEPSVFDGPEITLPKDTRHRCGDEILEHREVHNLYGFWVQESLRPRESKASVQGHLLRQPEQRPFVLTRSFFAGSHRHGAAWTGDNMANWRHLERSVPMLLSLSLCGLSLAGADVAGFMGDPDLELFVRWHQLGIWYPFYRAHAHLTSKRREPWIFGTTVLEKVRSAVLTRYRLLPMWYTLAAEWALLGLPMIRPIWYHDLQDTQAFQHADSHFFVGEALLVRAPETSKSEPLHKHHVPVFVRSGHCLVQRWRPRRSSGAMEGDPYTVVCYGQPATGRVYIDDGRSHEYQKGAYILDEITLDFNSLRGTASTLLDKTQRAASAPSVVERRVITYMMGLLGPEWTEDSYDIYVKNSFLVFEAPAETEGRRLRAASCPAHWRVHTLAPAVPVAPPVTMQRTSGTVTDADLHIQKTNFAQTTSSTMAPCDQCSESESELSSRRSSEDQPGRSGQESKAVVVRSLAGADGGEDTEDVEELEMHRKINRQLSAGSTPAMILQVVERNLNTMNGINLSTAFHRLSRCRGQGLHGPQAKVLAAMLQLAEAKATQELHCRDGTLPANCCTIIAWSCATLKVFSGPLFSVLIAVLVQSSSTCEVYEVSNLLWACAQYQKAAFYGGPAGPWGAPPAFDAADYNSLACILRGCFARRQLQGIKTAVLVSAFTSTAAVLQQSEFKRVLLNDFRDVLRRRLSELSELQRKLVFGPKRMSA
eukprot:s2240_g9.t1